PPIRPLCLLPLASHRARVRSARAVRGAACLEMIPTNTWRLALAVLLGFIALNALGGAVYGLAGAEGVPLEWLEGSPFDSYVVPSLILLLAVGGTALAAST